MLAAFVWNDRYNIGIEAVDAQHRHLFEIVNRVGELLIANPPAEAAAIDEIFRELAVYARHHFHDEETLMRSAGIDQEHFDHHVASHRAFVEQLKAMWAERSNLRTPAETLHGFLTAWLSYHILGEDQVMARELAKLRGKTVPAEQSERSTAALLAALQTLYRVLAEVNADLVETNRRLEEKVAARSRELVQTEKMAAIGQLAAGVAHEINNPIGFVSSNLGTLSHYLEQLLPLAELGSQTPEGAKRARQIDFDFLRSDLGDLLRESREGLERVARIVTVLKDFSRVDQAQWQDADLLAGLESTLIVLGPTLRQKANIQRELAPLPLVRCVPAQINQALFNLLLNAVQAIATSGTITLRSGQSGERVWLEIEDDGCGMDEVTQRRMFEPFFTTRPVGSGMGLGLAQVWDIVHKHGGQIETASQPGQGTRVRLWLPIAGPLPSDSSPASG